MIFGDFLQISAKEIDIEIERFFNSWSKDVEHISGRLLPFVDALEDACSGGKRIRGALVKLGYEMLGGKSEEILKVASAVEIFQTAILSHDDIIDKSQMRRGKKSLYARLGGDHGGVSKAICLGDIGYFLAFRIIAESCFEEKQKSRVMRIFSKMTLETAVGELLDVELTGKDDGNNSFFEKEIVGVYEYKTAHYTITGPLMIGAVLGGASEEQVDTIRIFGRNLGIAFQIQDDINDIFSERKVLGKESGGDIREGKKTLLYWYAREHADENGREILKKCFGNSEISEEGIGKIAQVFEKSGALRYAKGQAEKYAVSAREVIGVISKDAFYRDMFLGMTEYFLR